jgi:hypothetical protein
MDESMDKELIEKVLLAHVDEQRRSRRWANMWRAATVMLILVAIVFSYAGGGASVSHPTSRHTALIEVSGTIDSEGDASADIINGSLREAFANSHAAGVILRINSPGGSPVQSGIVFDEIRRLKKEHADKPVIAVVEDIAASGGYYVAVAADAIYVDKASLLGSIGVRMDGFGFTEAMRKVGVERRNSDRWFSACSTRCISSSSKRCGRAGAISCVPHPTSSPAWCGRARAALNWAWPMASGLWTAWRAMSSRLNRLSITRFSPALLIA